MRLKDQSAQKFRRQTIVKLYEEGYTQKRISELLSVNQSYISRILKKYQEQGESALAVSTGKGALSRMSLLQKKRLQVLLDGGAEAFGFEGAIWTSKRVRQVIQEKFRVSYSARQVQRILKQLGYTPQKPLAVEDRHDATAAKQWKEEMLPTHKKKQNKNHE